jgi:hypothetical protein
MWGSSEVIEGIVTKSAHPPWGTVCRYCNLRSAVTNHGSVGECVDALQREVARLRNDLREGTPGVSVVSEHAPVRDTAAATWARLRRAG